MKGIINQENTNDQIYSQVIEKILNVLINFDMFKFLLMLLPKSLHFSLRSLFLFLMFYTFSHFFLEQTWQRFIHTLLVFSKNYASVFVGRDYFLC